MLRQLICSFSQKHSDDETGSSLVASVQAKEVRMKKILLALCLIGLTSCAAAAEGRTEVYKAQSITQTET